MVELASVKLVTPVSVYTAASRTLNIDVGKRRIQNAGHRNSVTSHVLNGSTGIVAADSGIAVTGDGKATSGIG